MGRWKKVLPWLLTMAVVLLALVLLVYTYGRQREELAIPEEISARLGQGVAEGVNGVGSGFRDFFTWLFGWRELVRENQELSQKLAEEKALNELLQENENQRLALESLLTYQENLGMKSIAARVIAADAGSWIEQCTLNVGADDGVTADAVVVNTRGVVGRVIEVGPGYCKVMTVVDPRSSVNVMIERSRDEGILKGCQDPDAQEPDCDLVYLPFNADMVPGDAVLTSNRGGVFPQGLTVGKITEAASGKTSGQYARVLPAVDFGHLDYVLVLTEGAAS